MSVAGAGLPFLIFTMPKRIIRPPQRYDLEEEDFTEFIFDSGSEDDMDEPDSESEHRPEGLRVLTVACMY